jgi:transcriptional regulator with XRE-family HTH domain
MRRRLAQENPQRIRGIAVNGELLRALRRQCGLTQEEAAHVARVSVRLISKAEAGGPIDAWSLRALADLLTRPDRPVIPHDLAAAPDSLSDAAEQPYLAVVLLNEFLRGMWEGDWRQTLERLTDAQITFHCEQGTLVGRTSLAARVERLHQALGPARILVHEPSGAHAQAACRWRLTAAHHASTPDAPTPHAATVRHGMTSLIAKGSRVVQAWEFWDPEPLRSILPRTS